MGMQLPEVQKLGAIAGLEEMVGRATEMGRPIQFNFVGGVRAINTLPALSYFAYMCRLCAERDAQIIGTTGSSEGSTTMVAAEEIMRSAYVEAGKPERFDRENIRYLSDSQFSHNLGVLGTLAREKPAGVFYGGTFVDVLPLVEQGHIVGAIQVGGTNSNSWLPFFVAGCDYVFLGEEYFAGASYVSENPIELSALFGQDILKFIFLALIIIGMLAITAGSDFLLKLFLGG
jgi:hypothetical protein